MFNKLYDKCLKLASHKSANLYLSIVSFVESSFFPIPPDVMIIPMVIAKKYGFASLEFHDEPHYENLTELQSILSTLELPVNGMNVRMGETFGCAALSDYNKKY